jgi:hypothetical protein
MISRALAMKNSCQLTFCFALAFIGISSLGAEQAPGKAEAPAVIVMPADDARLVVAEALTRLRKVAICTYAFKDGAESPILRYWERATGKWQETDLDDYEAMAVFQDFPERMLLVLNGKHAEKVMTSASEWCFDVTKVNKPSMAAFEAAIRTMFSFSDKELDVPRTTGVSKKIVSEKTR